MAEHLEHRSLVEQVRRQMPQAATLYRTAEMFKVFGDPTRTRILSALFSGELCVCCISEILEMSVSAVSHQLRILRQAHLVKARRCGKEMFYSLDDDHIAQIYDLALAHVEEGKSV